MLARLLSVFWNSFPEPVLQLFAAHIGKVPHVTSSSPGFWCYTDRILPLSFFTKFDMWGQGHITYKGLGNSVQAVSKIRKNARKRDFTGFKYRKKTNKQNNLNNATLWQLHEFLNSIHDFFFFCLEFSYSQRIISLNANNYSILHRLLSARHGFQLSTEAVAFSLLALSAGTVLPGGSATPATHKQVPKWGPSLPLTVITCWWQRNQGRGKPNELLIGRSF